MQTRLEAMEEAERWSAWGSSEFLAVEGPTGERVPLSRWDVHQLLVGATEVAFSGAGVGHPATRETVFVCGGGIEEVKIERPADARGWLGELMILPGTPNRFYQVGPWIIRVSRPDYYAFVHGATNQGDADTYARMSGGGDSYRAMYAAGTACDDRTAVVLSFLQGTPARSVPAEMARLTVAMYVSEAARNHRTWGVNLMLLDLLRSGQIGWGNLILDGLHPMAKGGTFAQGKTGMQGGRESAETWAHETSIAMAWLVACSGLKVTPQTAKPGARWRDPVKAHAHVSATRRRLQGLFLQRMRHVGLTWDPI
jgi:hypothetical protein